MADIENLIASEHAKIALFKAKIEESEKRVAVLQSIKSEDAVDLAAGAAISAKASNSSFVPVFVPSAHREPTKPQDAESVSPKRKIGEVGLTIMNILKDGEKNLNQIYKAIEAKGVTSTPHNTRCTLRAFKEKYDFFSTPRSGVYALTLKGSQYLRDHKGEGVATGHSNAFGHQPVSARAH